MAHSLSAKKRIRQNEVLRTRNRARKGAIKTQIRKFSEAVRGHDVDRAQAEFRLAVKKLDRTAAKGTLHKNAVARRKSRLAKQLNKLTAEQQG